MYLAFLVIIFRLVFPSSSTEDCLSSDDSTFCCAGFYEDGGKCTPCGSGYFGPNCSHACPYPKYGRRCLEGECRCPEPICDPVAGCAISKYKNVIIIPFNSYANVIY
ncbi:uncharacterized protein LOC144622324 [Crassostrea virginica]